MNVLQWRFCEIVLESFKVTLMKEDSMIRSMTLMFVIVTMFFLISQPMPVVGKTSSSDVSKEMGEAWETFKSYVVDQKNDAVKHGNEMLKDADAEIERLEGKAAKASDDAKAQYEKEIKNLKEKRAAAAAKLDELQNSSADAWDSTKEGFAEAYKDLHDAYNEAVGKFE
jgi:peptidoglycan hydrolase CwlO-like protein